LLLVFSLSNCAVSLFALTFFHVSHFSLLISVLFQTCHASVNSLILLPYSGFQFSLFLGQVPNKLLDIATFSDLANMTPEDLSSPVAVAETAQSGPRTSQKPQLQRRFECLFTPFGLSNTTQTFQRMMDRTTDGLEGVFAYIWTTHVSVLQIGKDTSAIWRLFSQLWQPMASPSIWKNVCLQHLLLRFLKIATPSGYQAAATFSWHGKLLPPFLPKCAQILKPLTDLLKGGAKTLEWTISAQEAFQNSKCLLAAAVPLQHPAPNAELSLATDTCDTHIGVVMQQKSGDQWRPLGFSPANSQTQNPVTLLLIANY
jgi:hypothetical protein